MLYESNRQRAMLTLFGLAFITPLACGSNREAPGTASGSFDPDAGQLDASRCGYRCSRDLKKVLKTCDGQSDAVEVECPPDQGCGGDRCVAACDAVELSKGSAGCGFWTLPPDDALYGGPCFAAMIANTWDRPVTISAEWGADPLDVTNSIFTASRTSGLPVYTKLDGPLPSGQVAILFLSQDENLTAPDAIQCPEGVTPALHVDPLQHGTARTKAFHIMTDAPVAAYSIFPYGGAESHYPTATLLLPQSSWDKNYLSVNPEMAGDPEASYNANRTMQIIAAEDDTQVSIRPTFEILRAADVDPAVTGEVATWT